MSGETLSIVDVQVRKAALFLEGIGRGIFLMSISERRTALWLVCSSLINAQLQAVALAAVIPVIMVMLNLSELPVKHAPTWIAQWLAESDKKHVMLMLGGCVCVLTLVRSAYAWAHAGWMARFSSRCEKRLDSILMRQILTTHYAWLVQQNSTRIRELAVNSTPYWARQFVGTLLKLVNDLMLVLVVVLLLIWVNLIVGVLTVVVCLLFASAIYFLVRPVHRRLAAEKQSAQIEVGRMSTEAIFSAKEIKMAGMEGKVLSIFEGHVARSADATAKDIQWATIPRLSFEVIVYGGLVGLGIVIVSFKLQSMELSGEVLLYGLAALRLTPVLSTLVFNLAKLSSSFPIIDDLYWVINETVSTELPPTDTMTETSWQKISLEQVVFKYDGAKRNAIQGISLTIRRGFSYGIVGPSGAGKSTVIDLVAGLLEPSIGEVRIDDISLVAASRRNWRRRFGYVAQRPFLLDASLWENITFNFSSDMDEEKLNTAIKLASLEQVVARLPKGAASRLGEQGNLLSGGERQRIAIARALYRGADILILDEATSSLDPLVEREIAESILSLHGRVTIIVVSHRLGLVRHCDEIMVFDGGGLSARGTHEELLRSSGLYGQMMRVFVDSTQGQSIASKGGDHRAIALPAAHD